MALFSLTRWFAMMLFSVLSIVGWSSYGDESKSPDGMQPASFHGILLSARDAQPIVGADLRFIDKRRAALSDASGRFVVALEGEPQNAQLMILARGFLSRTITVDGAHATLQDAAVIEMDRKARLTVAIYDQTNKPLRDAEVVISARDHDPIGSAASLALPNEEWRARTNGRGRVQFIELPAERSLYASIRFGEYGLREIEWPLLLAGDEHVSVGWVVDRGRERAGVLRGPSGESIAGVRLLLMANDDGPFDRRRPRHISEHGGRRVVREVVTDSFGAFVLPALAHGWYRIGPAPGGSFVPLAVALEHDVRDEPSRIQVDALRGVTIRGRVLGSDGLGLGGGLVFAEQPGVAGVLSTRCIDDGRFVLSPVPDTALRLLARDERFGFETQVVELPAGQRRIVLHIE